MALRWRFSLLLLALMYFLGVNTTLAQTTPRSFLSESEFDLTLPSENDWSLTLGFANRYLFFNKLNGQRLEESKQQHFELNQFTHYKLNENASFSLGFRYRFREAFEESRHDEFRIIQQFEHKFQNVRFTPEQRLRFEQRFRDLTIYRIRYQVGIKQSLGEEFDLEFSTEFLYSMVIDYRPEVDQRFTIELENSSFQNLDLSAGVEYRREDYTGAPGTEYFIFSGVNLKL